MKELEDVVVILQMVRLNEEMKCILKQRIYKYPSSDVQVAQKPTLVHAPEGILDDTDRPWSHGFVIAVPP